MKDTIYGYELSFVTGLLIISGLQFFMGFWAMRKHSHEFENSKSYLTNIFINTASPIQVPIIACFILVLTFICISLIALWAVIHAKTMGIFNGPSLVMLTFGLLIHSVTTPFSGVLSSFICSAYLGSKKVTNEY